MKRTHWFTWVVLAFAGVGAIVAIPSVIAAKEKDQALAEESKQQAAKDDEALIQKKQVRVGMTADQCIRAWGKPYKVNRTTTESATREQWVYRPGGYLYLTNGVLKSIQN